MQHNSKPDNRQVIKTSVVYHHTAYPAWQITYKDKDYLFATIALEEELLPDGECYEDLEAELVDNKIIYYFDETEQRHISWDFLTKIAESEYSGRRA